MVADDAEQDVALQNGDGDGLPECDYGFHLFLRCVIWVRLAGLLWLLALFALVFYQQGETALATACLLFPSMVAAESLCFWGAAGHADGGDLRTGFQNAALCGILVGILSLAAFGITAVCCGRVSGRSAMVMGAVLSLGFVFYGPLQAWALFRAAGRYGFVIPGPALFHDWRLLVFMYAVLGIGYFAFLLSWAVRPEVSNVGFRLIFRISVCLQMYPSLVYSGNGTLLWLVRKLRKRVGTGLTPGGGKECTR